jgi:hypothetical protein
VVGCGRQLPVRAHKLRAVSLENKTRNDGGIAHETLLKLRRALSNQDMEARTVSVPKLGWSLAELEVATGLSRSLLYRMMAAGQLITIKVRGRRLVPGWQAERLLQTRPQEQTA